MPHISNTCGFAVELIRLTNTELVSNTFFAMYSASSIFVAKNDYLSIALIFPIRHKCVLCNNGIRLVIRHFFISFLILNLAAEFGFPFTAALSYITTSVIYQKSFKILRHIFFVLAKAIFDLHFVLAKAILRIQHKYRR